MADKRSSTLCGEKMDRGERKGTMYRRAYWPNEGTKASPKTYSPTPEGYKKSIDPSHVDQEGRTEPHIAMLDAGDDDQHIEKVIKAGCDINVGDKNDRKPVHYAAERGKTRCIQMLVKHGANLNILDKFGHTPLTLAARHGYPKAVRTLCRAGANPNMENDKSELALHYAVCNGHVECVEDLLAARSKVNYPDVQGSTPLMQATKCSKQTVMRTLLAAGANPDLKDSYGKTALHWASALGSVQMIEILLECGAQIDMFDVHGHSPFLYTILANQYSALEYLLEAGCDRNTVDGLNGTAIGLACIKGHNQCVDVLLRTGDDPDEVGFFGLTPLMAASFESHVDVVKTLLNHGANPNIHGRMGATPLIKALVRVCPGNAVKRHQIITTLLRAGADVNFRVVAAGYFTGVTNGKNCPLSFAMCSGYISLVRILLLTGSQVSCSEVKLWYGRENIDRFYDTRKLIQPICEWKSEPRSLKHACREVIRSNINVRGIAMSKAIRQLPIAPVLQDFVDLYDLDEIQPEQALPSNIDLLHAQPVSGICAGMSRMLEGTFLLQSATGAMS